MPFLVLEIADALENETDRALVLKALRGWWGGESLGFGPQQMWT